MDRLTPEQRHKNMSNVRNRGTKPELKVRKWLWQRGFRYRLNDKSIQGCPDIVLRKFHTVIFINGCFWHGHENCKKAHLPETNQEFWSKKIQGNMERDKINHESLQKSGWQVIVIWECQLKKQYFENTMLEVEQKIMPVLTVK
ncbi:MAG: very short patch repair endonuclease [Bacteroidales bacterium]|nr:very short patch repair endonuclease [Bacteroidales bacterium]